MAAAAQTFDWQVYAPPSSRAFAAKWTFPVYPAYPSIMTTKHRRRFFRRGCGGSIRPYRGAGPRAGFARICGDRSGQRQFHANRNDVRERSRPGHLHKSGKAHVRHAARPCRAPTVFHPAFCDLRTGVHGRAGPAALPRHAAGVKATDLPFHVLGTICPSAFRRKPYAAGGASGAAGRGKAGPAAGG